MSKQFFLFILLWAFNLNAQVYSGHHIGLYSGVNGIQFNPASFVHKKPLWDIQIFGVEGSIYSDYSYIADQSVFSLLGKDKVQNASDSIPSNFNSNSDALMYNRDYKESIIGALINANVKLPSFCFRYKNLSFGLFNNFRIGMDNTDLPAFFNYRNLKEKATFTITKIPAFTANAMIWREMGFHIGYSHELDNEHYLSVGLNPKFLMGYEAGFVQNKSEVGVEIEGDTFVTTGANVSIGFASGASKANNSYNFDSRGSGMGVDFGLEYMIPSFDEESRSPHYMKFGIAVRDIGAINFNQNAEKHDFVTKNIIEVANTISENKNHNYDIIKRVSNAFYGDSSMSLKAKEFTIYLPTSLNLHWDYNIRDDFYIHAIATRRIKTLKQQLSAPNVFLIGGRYERRWIEAGASASLTEDKWVGIGAYVRLGVLTIGSDHINTFFFSQPELRGTDFYLSLRILPFTVKERDGKIDRIKIAKTRCYSF